MGHHLTADGKFKSDKYSWCPSGFFALKFTDPKARHAIEIYAAMVMRTDPELAADLLGAVAVAEVTIAETGE